MPIIIDIEKDKHKVINSLILFLSIFKKITILPRRVDIPAIVDISMALNVDIWFTN